MLNLFFAFKKASAILFLLSFSSVAFTNQEGSIELDENDKNIVEKLSKYNESSIDWQLKRLVVAKDGYLDSYSNHMVDLPNYVVKVDMYRDGVLTRKDEIESISSLNGLTNYFSVNENGKVTSIRLRGLKNSDWSDVGQLSDLISLSVTTGETPNLKVFEKAKPKALLLFWMPRVELDELPNKEELVYVRMSLKDQENFKFMEKYPELRTLIVNAGNGQSLKIECMPNLQYLVISEAKLSVLDLKPNSVPKLEVISLYKTKVPKKNNLETLTSVKSFNLQESTDDSLSNIDFPDSVKYLSLFKSELNDYSFITTAPNLEVLNIKGSNFNQWHLLEKLPNLKALNASKTSLGQEDLKNIANLKNLTHLNVNDTNIDSLEPIYGLKEIRQLLAGGSNLSSLEEFDKFSKLAYPSFSTDLIESKYSETEIESKYDYFEAREEECNKSSWFNCTDFPGKNELID